MAGVKCIKELIIALLHYIVSDWLEILFNIIFIITVGIFAVIFKGDSWNFQAFRAFDYKDNALGYIHKPSVVTGNMNIFVSFVFAIVASLIGNAFTKIGSKETNKKADQQLTVEINMSSKLSSMKEIECLKAESKVRLYRIVWGLIYLIIAVIETNLITNFTKTSMGVLKPHFLTECKPDQAIIEALEANGTSWVDEKLTLTICTNEDTDNRRSFPSGHASQAGVAVMYSYLEVNDLPKMLVASRFLQIVGVLYAVLICALRISNNQHHWPDVLVGLTLGALIALSAFVMKEKQVKRQFRMSACIKVAVPSEGDAEATNMIPLL
ncbi:phospholipid phosphatase 2-like [Bolinopsis microptera]|uniref:phospholipid phosphatase 2-like n=1 Tax=Bolinopsis microptera TaxID=2820187 RepID=UPI00307AD78F